MQVGHVPSSTMRHTTLELQPEDERVWDPQTKMWPQTKVWEAQRPANLTGSTHGSSIHTRSINAAVRSIQTDPSSFPVGSAGRNLFQQEIKPNWDTYVHRRNSEQLEMHVRAASANSARAANKANALQLALDQTTAKLLDAQSRLEMQDRSGMLIGVQGLGLSHRQAPEFAGAQTPGALAIKQAIAASFRNDLHRRAASSAPHPQSARQPKEQSVADAKHEARLRQQIAWTRFHARISPRNDKDPPKSDAVFACISPSTYWDGLRRSPPVDTGYSPAVHRAQMNQTSMLYRPAPPPARPSRHATAPGDVASAAEDLLGQSLGQEEQAPRHKPTWATESYLAKLRGRNPLHLERDARERRLRQRLGREAEDAAAARRPAPAPLPTEEPSMSMEEMMATEASLSAAEANLDRETVNLHNFLRMKIETRFKQLRRAFRLIDLDKSGSCDRAEVRQMLQHLFNCQVDHGPMELLLDLLDFDGSGHIELREFARFFTNDGERIDLRERLAQMHKARARQAQACAPPHRAPLRRPASAR